MTTNLGLKENWKQFSLLVIVNMFVGAMIGTERSVFTSYAEENFNITAYSALLSFIAVFGLSKAIANYYLGKLLSRFGRRIMLISGWLIVLPVPFLLIYAQNWWWVILANVILGISQGFTWSSTIIMKIDLVGPKNRGLAMGLNEFAGYAAVGIMALITGWMAERYAIVPHVFYLAMTIALIGLITTVLFVRDTTSHMLQEAEESELELLNHVALDTTIRNKNLSTVTQAGLINNMNDGMLWGLLPVLLIKHGYSEDILGLIVFVYPFVWGVGQLFTGKMSDHFNLKSMLFWGMLMQGGAILGIFLNPVFWNLIMCSIILGVGTALVYPTFFTVISKIVNPSQRAESIGVFRLWRDGGYVFGAIFSGLLADLFSVEIAVLAIGGITICSAIIIQFRMKTIK